MAILQPLDVNRTGSKSSLSRFIFIIIGLTIIQWSSSAQQLSTIAPSAFVAGKPYLFALEAENNGLDLFYSETVATSVTGGVIENNSISIRKGRAMASVQTDGSTTLNVAAGSFNLQPTQNQSSIVTHSGNTNGSLVFESGSVHLINGQLNIGQGDTLTIEAGCWVLLDTDVNISVEGHLQIDGTSIEPVAFTSNGNSAWGGIIFGNGTGTINYCLFSNGGGDDSQWFGHSDSQPVIRTNGGQVTMNRSFIFDCQGKALAAMNGNLVFNNGGISRCDTGGEFGSSYVVIKGSHVMEIPDADGLLEDDDNDGLYFFGANITSEPNVVDSCVFVLGEDDGIDHNGAIVHVLNTWVEGFANEGVAASNENSVYIYNSLFKACEQGIEAGYGSPTVTVDHCVLVENDYGLRFGDWYNWGCNGSITCTNSIMVNNTDNVHNFDVLNNGPINGALTVTYSIPTDVEYDADAGNLTGAPNFTSQYQLEPGSVGESAATDGSNMGLIAPTLINIRSPLLPAGNLLFSMVYNLQGQLVLRTENRLNPAELNQNFSGGIYLVKEVFKTGHSTKKIFVQ